TTTHRPETRIKPGGSLANAREVSREKQRTERRERAKTGLRNHPPLSRPCPETAPILAFQAKKIPTDKGWDLVTWWTTHQLHIACNRPAQLRQSTSRSDSTGRVDAASSFSSWPKTFAAAGCRSCASPL